MADDDVIPEEFPPEQPYAVNDPLTPDEEQMGDSLADRVKRERPDHLGTDEGRVGTLVAPDGDETGIDTEATQVASEIEPAQEKEGVISAEEAAMHTTEPPPMGDGDGYVDEDD